MAQNLVEQREERLGQVRSLSDHVISRWYRPPEVILREKNYDTAVDVWSLGCVLAELLFCSENNKDQKFNLG